MLHSKKENNVIKKDREKMDPSFLSVPKIVTYLKNNRIKTPDVYKRGWQLYKSITENNRHRIDAHLRILYRAQTPVPLLRAFLFSCTILEVGESGAVEEYHCGVYVNASTQPTSIQMTTCSCLSSAEADAGTTCMHVVTLLSYAREQPLRVRKTNVDPSEALGMGGAWKIKLTDEGSAGQHVLLPPGKDYILGRTSPEFISCAKLSRDAFVSRRQLVLHNDRTSCQLFLKQVSTVNKTQIRIPVSVDHNSAYITFRASPGVPINLFPECQFFLYADRHSFAVTIAQPSNPPAPPRAEQAVDCEGSLPSTSHSQASRPERSVAKAKELPFDLNNVERQMECSICVDILYKPVALVCNHKFCRQCWYEWAIQSLKKDDVILCPECREKQKNADPPLDTVTCGLLEILFKKNCEARKAEEDPLKLAAMKTELVEMNEIAKKKRKSKRTFLSGFSGRGSSAANTPGGGGPSASSATPNRKRARSSHNPRGSAKGKTKKKRKKKRQMQLIDLC
jgi:hypothetical protein